MRLLILTEKEKRGIHHFRFTVSRLKSLLRYRSDIYVQSEDGIIRVYYPEQDDFAEEMMQNIGQYASIENYHFTYEIVEDAQISVNTVKWKGVRVESDYRIPEIVVAAASSIPGHG